jgi:hypothetical protein
MPLAFLLCVTTKTKGETGLNIIREKKDEEERVYAD